MSLPAYRKPYSGQGSGEWNSPAAPGSSERSAKFLGRASERPEDVLRTTLLGVPCSRVEQPTSEHVHENHKKTESPLEPGHAQPPARRSGRRLRDHTLDSAGRIASWSAGAARLFGHDASEILGRDYACFHTRKDRDAGVPQQALRQADAEGRFETEGWRVRSNGKRFWAQVVIDAIRDSQGQLSASPS